MAEKSRRALDALAEKLNARLAGQGERAVEAADLMDLLIRR
jgi:hypothetical protein